MQLLPVEVKAAPVVSGGDSLEVLTASGERVSFAVGTDVAYVARLVAALEHKAC